MIELKRWDTDEVIWSGEAENVKDALERAVKERKILYRVNLSWKELNGANLIGANLIGANLIGANLDGARLVGANLIGARLDGANLDGANLIGANLIGANLDGARLDGASLDGARLDPIRADYFDVLRIARAEVVPLYKAICDGKINGSVYEGECACLVGTIANARKENFKALGIDLRPDSSRLAEKWFLAFRRGDTPESNPVAAITKTWTEEFMRAEGIVVPTRRVTWSGDL